MPTTRTILHLVTDLRVGGAQVLLLERIRRSRAFAHAVLVFARHTGRPPRDGVESGDLSAAFRETGVPLLSLELATPGRALAAWMTGAAGRTIDRFLRDTRPDLMHSTLFHGRLLGDQVARRHRIPHIAAKEGLDRWMGPVARAADGRALRRADGVVAVSQATAAEARRLGSGTVTVIANGIDPERPGGWMAPKARSGGPRLLGVGRLARAKGWEDLIDALPLLCREYPGISLDLIGQGRERDALMRRAGRLGLAGRLRIFAPQEGGEPDRSGEENGNTILVVPSREEGFGLVLLEGMARGLPLVATRTGGIPEVARHEREALLSEPKSPEGLAEAIARLLRDPDLRRALVQAGRERVRSYPLEGMVRAYEALYRELLGMPDDTESGS